jgi:cytochrome c
MATMTQLAAVEWLHGKRYFLASALFVGFVITLLCVSLYSVEAASGTGGDPERGKQLFEKRCGGCHSPDQDKEGPRLRTVFGRKAGSVPSYKYSAALKSANIIWDESSLDKWLTNTDSLIPDNDMDFQVQKAEERADIIRYLKVVSGK